MNPVIIFFIIIVINLAISVRLLIAIHNEQIVRFARFLKYVNIIHLVAACLLILYDATLGFWGGRDEAILGFFIFSLFGVASLVSNLVCALIRVFSRFRGPEEPRNSAGN